MDFFLCLKNFQPSGRDFFSTRQGHKAFAILLLTLLFQIPIIGVCYESKYYKTLFYKINENKIIFDIILFFAFITTSYQKNEQEEPILTIVEKTSNFPKWHQKKQ
ncbi:hypothetical protein HR11_04420 [Porphyromonas macacae]|nr:hypothetical protein HR11_04420 [Porphyromonas macacae]